MSTMIKGGQDTGMTDTGPLDDNPWRDLDLDGNGLSVHDFLTTRLSAVMGALRKQVTMPYARSADLSISEWRILSLIAHSGTIPFSQLVIESASDKALVSRGVQALERRGLILTRPETETARKRIACQITKAGQALHDQIITIARRRQAEVLHTLTADERAALFGILVKLRASLGPEMDGEG